MSSGVDWQRRRPTVFLSYASEDRAAARLLGETLPGCGLEVWYDESELGGGDAWDQKIRRQIRECDYFMPLVSAHTEARHEGYFRREWRLAVERTLDMADDHLFLLPIVIDDTDEMRARVPEKFLAVQWLRVPGGRATPALEALCRRLVSPEPAGAPPARRAAPMPLTAAVLRAPTPVVLQFPRQEPGQRVRFWVEVLAWTCRSLWALFKRLPRWIRALVIVWLVFILVTRGCVSRHPQTTEISPAAAARIKSIARQYQGGSNEAETAKLAAQIAHEFSGAPKAGAADRQRVLAIPFLAPAGDASGAQLADAAFGQLYGRIALSQHGRLGMASGPLPSCGLAGMVERGRAVHSVYVLCGVVESQAAGAVLTIRIASPSDEAFLWSKSYPVQGTDPALIAAEVDAKLTALDDD